jgi:hypothetical protein
MRSSTRVLLCYELQKEGLDSLYSLARLLCFNSLLNLSLLQQLDLSS